MSSLKITEFVPKLRIWAKVDRIRKISVKYLELFRTIYRPSLRPFIIIAEK